ncbi:hypothetical protein [Brevibacterium sp.]|uniref:hypothetical protein n=1 Tax=Brevibacterium sp. TaxID=1701 RepID=UPI002810BA7C|nr:hypothetical protein [Brevibacterium sp.]
MGRSNAWTSEVDWTTGQWQERRQTPPHRGWRPPTPRGVLAKRPLTFFEVLDSGFRLLRFDPGLTIGSALIVFSLWTLALTAVGTFLVLRFFPVLSEIVADDEAMSGFLLLVQAGSFALSLLSLGVVHLLAGLTAPGVEDSYLARRTSLSASWRRLRGRRLPLVSATVLMSAVNAGLLVLLALPALAFSLVESFALAVVCAVVAFLLWAAALVWLNVRFAFTGVVIATEGLGVRPALLRSWRLTRHGFWRTFGQLALGYFLSNQLVQLVITPFLVILMGVFSVLLATSESETALTVLGIVGAGIVLLLSTVASAVLFAYFSCLVCACCFDRQVRTEGFDLALIRRSEEETR